MLTELLCDWYYSPQFILQLYMVNIILLNNSWEIWDTKKWNSIPKDTHLISKITEYDVPILGIRVRRLVKRPKFEFLFKLVSWAYVSPPHPSTLMAVNKYKREWEEVVDQRFDIILQDHTDDKPEWWQLSPGHAQEKAGTEVETIL